MLKARKSILVMIFVLFVLASFGIANADNIGGLSNVGPTTVYVNPGGLGDALLFNYYNARNGMETFFTVVNTSSKGERVRIRFREAGDVATNGVCTPEEPRGSFEVLDFDICLTAHDMWSGFVTAAPGGVGAMLCSNDVDTLIFDGTASGVFPESCVPFKFGSLNAVPGITAIDTMEGYFEIIGEDQLQPDFTTCEPIANIQCSGTAGVPNACCTSTILTSTCPDLFTDVPNVLSGQVALIDGNTSATFTYNATALANFGQGNLQQSPTTSQPDLTAAFDGLNGVNFVLTKNHISSVYDLIHARTEFVLTEPTKALTQLCGTVNDIFDDTTAVFTAFNDAEQSKTSGCTFSPCPQGTANNLPFEVNIIKMIVANHISDILTSEVDQPFVGDFDFGWFDIDLTKVTAKNAVAHQVTFGGTTNAGWPILGLMFIDVDQGVSTGAIQMDYTQGVPTD